MDQAGVSSRRRRAPSAFHQGRVVSCADNGAACMTKAFQRSDNYPGASGIDKRSWLIKQKNGWRESAWKPGPRAVSHPPEGRPACAAQGLQIFKAGHFHGGRVFILEIALLAAQREANGNITKNAFLQEIWFRKTA